MYWNVFLWTFLFFCLIVCEDFFFFTVTSHFLSLLLSSFWGCVNLCVSSFFFQLNFYRQALPFLYIMTSIVRNKNEEGKSTHQHTQGANISMEFHPRGFQTRKKRKKKNFWLPSKSDKSVEKKITMIHIYFKDMKKHENKKLQAMLKDAIHYHCFFDFLPLAHIHK